MDDWQPIATAPRDGTPVLVYVPEGVSEFPINDDYDAPQFKLMVYVCRWPWGPDAAAKQPEWPHWKEAGGEDFATYEPTHWMPLPKAPVAAKAVA